MQHSLKSLLALYFVMATLLHAEIQLIKKENSDANTTLLVVSGIHGNEPGSYFAASILATEYTITSKNLWIIPNLNKISIRENSRGIHGDMNRKFSVIKKDDKDKELISELKNIILSKNVSLILNLHDGHGFYREKFQGNIFNPHAWGQTCVIDQCNLDTNKEFGDLNKIASSVRDSMNKKLIKKHHKFNVRNTKTKFDNKQMQLSLTYFAVTNNKPAFAIESSKNLSSLAQKVYYQLLAIEEFMKIMDISFTRKFVLNEISIQKIINNYGSLKINNNISINLSNIKKYLSYIPIKSKSNEFKFSHPLGSVKKKNGKYFVYIGNKKVTTLKPQYFKVEPNCPKSIHLELDGKQKTVKSATSFSVDDDFKVHTHDGVRVNVIGFSKKGLISEDEVSINRKSLNKRFSIDKKNKAYRVEFYKNKKFCSMSVVNFK